MNVTVVGGMGKLGSVMAQHIGRSYPVRIADVAPECKSTAETTKDADIVIVIVNTPSLPDGSYDIANVVAACSEIDLSCWRMVIISSTVNPGDTEGPIRAALEQSGMYAHADFGFAYVPEFVRQGNVQEDFAHPEFIVAGCATELERSHLESFYRWACWTKPTFMSIPSAEIAKIGLNTAITSKLAKANEIAWLCQRTDGADAEDVLNAIGQDSRIGPRYFKAGPPYGGPCFPRDDLAFSNALQQANVAPVMTESVACWNRSQMIHMAQLVREADLCQYQRFGVAGLSFKPGVVDGTESPGARLAELLNAETYDPNLYSTCETFEELIEQCDSVVLAMPFEGMDAILYMDTTGKTIWDWWGIYGDRFNRFGKGPELC